RYILEFMSGRQFMPVKLTPLVAERMIHGYAKLGDISKTLLWFDQGVSTPSITNNAIIRLRDALTRAWEPFPDDVVEVLKLEVRICGSKWLAAANSIIKAAGGLEDPAALQDDPLVNELCRIFPFHFQY